MDSLSFKNILDRPAKADQMQWYGHVLRRDNDDVVRRVLDFKVVIGRGREQHEMNWRRQVI